MTLAWRRPSLRAVSPGGSAARHVVKWAAGSPVALVGFVSALVGAGLATSIMAHGAIAEGQDYTVLSWALIWPLWSALWLLAALVRLLRLVAAIPLAWLASFAAFYYSDVYGQFPAAAFFLLAGVVVLRGPRQAGGRARRTPHAGGMSRSGSASPAPSSPVSRSEATTSVRPRRSNDT